MIRRPHNPKAPAFNRTFKRVMATGCSHGDLADPAILKQVLAFKKAYRPEITFELGDVIDTAAFRGGARGTKDESHPIAPDFYASKRWLEAYQPTNICWGNHCWRVYELQDHHNAILSHAASTIWNSLTDTAAKLKAKTVPYDFETGWFSMGGAFFGHGYWIGENAVRDHAEYLGGPVVMAHLHHPQQVQGRTRTWSPSFCVGTLANIPAMTYARRRRSTARWGAGIAFGELCEDEHHLWLAACEKGKEFHFPFKI